MFWLNFIKSFLKVLSEGQTPKQIALGFALGSIIGLSPMFTLQGLIIWVLILTLDVNISSALVAVTFFKFVAFIFDPLFHWLGFQLLTQLQFMNGTYTAFYNAPIAPLSRFNNTVVMGSFAAALVLFIPIYFGMKLFVIKYRLHIHEKIKRMKIYKILNQSKFINYYKKVKSLGGIR